MDFAITNLITEDIEKENEIRINDSFKKMIIVKDDIMRNKFVKIKTKKQD